MIKKSKVIAAIHEGVFNAHKKYEKWSGGEWIGDYGVEGFLVSEIASTIHQFQEDGEHLYLELPFSDIKARSGARKRRGRPTKGIRMARRVDIALCNENNEPVYVIEVKRKWDNTQCEKDLQKLRDLVTNFDHVAGGSLESGFLAVYVQERHFENDLKEEMKWTEEYAKNLRFPGAAVDFHKRSWEKKRAVYLEQEGVVSEESVDWEYGCHIIEVSRKQ